MISCAKKLATENSQSVVGKRFINQLGDSLNKWIENVEILSLQSYKEKEVTISDKILFNSSKDKGIGFVIKHRKEGESNDVVQLITGEKVGDNWKYYYLGNPTLLFSKCDGCDKKNEPLSEKEIENRMLENVVGLGYFKKNCIIDDEKFEEVWVTEFKRIDHKYRFLTGTYPKYHESFYEDGIKLPTK